MSLSLEVAEEVEEELTTGKVAENGTTTIKATKKRSKAKVEAEVVEEEAVEADSDAPKKPKRKRKTKEEKEAEAMPLAARTAGLRMYIGAHVSSAKGELGASFGGV